MSLLIFQYIGLHFEGQITWSIYLVCWSSIVSFKAQQLPLVAIEENRVCWPWKVESSQHFNLLFKLEFEVILNQFQFWGYQNLQFWDFHWVVNFIWHKSVIFRPGINISSYLKFRSVISILNNCKLALKYINIVSLKLS